MAMHNQNDHKVSSLLRIEVRNSTAYSLWKKNANHGVTSMCRHEETKHHSSLQFEM